MKYLLKFVIPILLLAGCKEKNSNKNIDSTSSVDNIKSEKEVSEIHKNINVNAEPDSIAMDASSMAVIVVDMENGFGAKGGMFDRAGIDISMIQKVVAPTAKVLAAARQADVKIIYLKMAYHENLSDIGTEESPNRMLHLRIMHVGDTFVNPDGSKSRMLIRETWSTEIVHELKPQAGDIVLYKTRFSGFYKTELDSLLKKMGKKYLIFTGCTTSVCVESTVRDAMFRDYSSVVLEDCVAEPIGYDLPRSNHEASLLTIKRLFGWVSSSEEFIKALKILPKKND